MRPIKAVVFDPVGSLAEFPSDPFREIAARLFEGAVASGTTGSEAYWQLLDAMEQSDAPLTPAQTGVVEDLEVEAAGKAHLYEDVVPALTELQKMKITLAIASSLSTRAVDRFLEQFALKSFFPGVWTRDTAGGIKAAPLAKAIAAAALDPEHVMALGDTADSLQVAKQVGANAILMINDYDEGRRLAMQAPAGGIVSLHELPDAIRLVAEGAKVSRP